ncbi:Uncharacterised protein [Klebsiella pneumoniae]|nr:Uncharacterised protein [Klebsiella pneumoniae]
MASRVVPSNWVTGLKRSFGQAGQVAGAVIFTWLSMRTLASGGSICTLTLLPSVRTTMRTLFRLTSSESGPTRNGLVSSPPSSLNTGNCGMLK